MFEAIPSTPSLSVSEQITAPQLAPPHMLVLRASDKSIKVASKKRKEHQPFAEEVLQKYLRGKIPQTEDDANRHPHRYHPGMVALREIRKYQRSMDLLIRGPVLLPCKGDCLTPYSVWTGPEVLW